MVAGGRSAAQTAGSRCSLIFQHPGGRARMRRGLEGLNDEVHWVLAPSPGCEVLGTCHPVVAAQGADRRITLLRSLP